MTSSISQDAQSRSTEGDAPLDPAGFRNLVSTVPSSVVVVTALDGDEPVGLVVGSFLAVSMDPPMAGFSPSVSSTSFPRLRRAGAFCANVLTTHQQNVSQAFAAPGADKFAGLSWRPAPATGSPVLDGVAAWIDCRITAVHEHGDHFIVVGEVADLGAESGEMPLVFHRRRYTALQSETQANQQ
jgi:3-hydroxy-9,10-secoandrosta-1,3,5(10)-triene-9,17-dione monooxygenase reductase component